MMEISQDNSWATTSLPATRAGGVSARRGVAPSLAVLAFVWSGAPLAAQSGSCPVPEALADREATPGRSATERMRDRDPLVREMARADFLSDAGRSEEASLIYRGLAATRADRRQTARRAGLRLAQLALSSGDFAGAEAHVATATAPGVGADIRASARRLTARLAHRREMAAAEAALGEIDRIAETGSSDAAIEATKSLLLRPCPYPDDYHSRVKTRLARIHRARGEFDQARVLAREAQASATRPTIQQGAVRLLAEIHEAEQASRVRNEIDRANGFMAAGNPAAAVGLLEPVLSGPALPPDLDATVRLRLARAYVLSGRHADAITLVEPLRAAPVALSPDQQEALSRIYLARAGQLYKAGNSRAAASAYQDVLGWNPPPVPEVRDSARLSLARALAAEGDRDGALQQVALVRDGGATPELVSAARNLFASINDGAPLNRLFGYVEAGIAYDSNAPTLVAAVREDDDDIGFPADRKFDDVHARLAARLQYRHQLGESGNYLDLAASGLRTFQQDLTRLDRTRVELAAGPVFASNGRRTEFRFGGLYAYERRGGAFRSSEPGVYLGVRQRFAPGLSAAAVYSLTWRNDYRNERDGIDHTLDAQLRYELRDTDRVNLDLRAEREGGKVGRVRSWRLLVGAGWRHRWLTGGRVVPFVEFGADLERVLFDRPAVVPGRDRRDWRVKAEASVGADIDRRWRARLRYAFYDIDSNTAGKDRRPNHQVGLSLRYMFN